MAVKFFARDVRSGDGDLPDLTGERSRRLSAWGQSGRTWAAISPLLIALIAWLWPIGFGGRMPVGGDVTQFSMGLMAYLHDALRAGRLPLWNDLWGFGFPGLAESQMGVFYPPHLILYGALSTERAYTASLVFHTLWGGIGAYWAARRLGNSPMGATLAGFVWTSSGFFVIHLPHQWGYTTGSWMPWAWGLAWPLVRGEASRRSPFLLAVVLTLQVLPGHFQLAFCTQVSLLVLAVWRLAEIVRNREDRGGLATLQTGPASQVALASTQRRGECTPLTPPFHGDPFAQGERAVVPRSASIAEYPNTSPLAGEVAPRRGAGEGFQEPPPSSLDSNARQGAHESQLRSGATEGAMASGEKRRLIACVSGPLLVVLAVGTTFPLAAMQLVPTLRLARLADGQRDFEYLSGFAASPIHLVSYVAPGLFHRSPLWRPLMWDPFHTSPEEHLAYVGLVPLFLAVGAIRYGFRADPVVRALAVVALVTLLLSLGPYAPGFRYLIKLPGFSFFRAPARWGMATGLMLSLLAGRGLDTWRTWPRPGRSLARFVACSVIATAIVLLGIELALASTSKPGVPAVAAIYERALKSLPWSGDPDFYSLAQEARTAASPNDLMVQIGLARQGWKLTSRFLPSFAAARYRIYLDELAVTAALLAALAGLVACVRWPRFFAGALVVITLIDLGLLGRTRPVDIGPIKALQAQSPVLAALARETRGTRVIETRQRNLPMVSGAGAVLAYRTLDVPALPSLTRLASVLPADEKMNDAVYAAFRVTGSSLRVLDPFETLVVFGSGGATRSAATAASPWWPTEWSGIETYHDPALAGWLFSREWVATRGSWASKFAIIDCDASWSVPFASTSERFVFRRGLVPLADGRKGSEAQDELRRVRTAVGKILADSVPSSAAIYRPTSRAWLVPLTEPKTADILSHWSGDASEVTSVIGKAVPLPLHSSVPERLEIEVQADKPSIVVVSQLADPQWRAMWSGPSGDRAAVIERVFGQPGKGAWQGIAVPEPGKWVLRLEYVGRDVQQGLAVSAIAWLLWGAGFLRWGRERSSRQGAVP
jgi:hypothetical protein